MKFLYQASVVVLIAVLFVNCSTKQSGVKVLSVADFKNKVESTKSNNLILDVRTKDELSQGTIPNAIHMDFFQSDFKAALEKLDKDVPCFVYCAAGVRSNKAAIMMSEMGFEEVYDLDGGMRAWQNAGERISN